MINKPIKRKVVVGIDISWELDGDAIMVKSSVPLDEETFDLLFPRWTMPTTENDK